MLPLQFAPQISYYNFTVDELVAPGTVVGTVKATTVNTGYVLTYSISGAGPNAYSAFPFRVVDVPDGSTGSGRLETTAIAPIDYNEGFQRYYATLTVTVRAPPRPAHARRAAPPSLLLPDRHSSNATRCDRA